MNAGLTKLTVKSKVVTPVVLTDSDTPASEATLEEWADKIADASRQAVEKTVDIGRVLLAAKKETKHGQWERMFRDHRHALYRPVLFTDAPTKMYMAIANHPV